NDEFLPVIAMAQCSIFSMYMRAVALPISYLSLAKGRSWVYLFTEAVYDVVAVLMIVGGYAWGGLQGAGIALSLAAAFDLALVWLTTRKVYGFRLWGKSFGVLALQLPFGLLAFVVTMTTEGLSYWLLGSMCFLCSATISIHKLLKETTLLQTLWGKVVKRFSGGA
ncbi:MAG: hypothetical protein IJP08_03860, partial [Bacteroidaceae bacterium]|nr:hypothetical protein [Bacteroidaceae bacterium]